MARPTSAGRQDDRWERWVRELRKGPSRPFPEHLEAFRTIFNNRRPRDGPPLVWRPSRSEMWNSNLGRFMAERKVRDFRDLHAWSVRERGEFWGAAIERLGIVFARRPDLILDLAGGIENPRWLSGARLSIVDSCFKAAAATPAIIAGAEGTDRLEIINRGELETLVNRVAAGVRRRGFERGDGIALYMPMTLECVAAYLGIIRAGCRVISVADSFSPRELARRCRLGNAEAVLTVESYMRAGKRIDLLSKVIEADVPKVIVIPAKSSGSPSDLRLRTQDLTWEDLLATPGGLEPGGPDPDEVINVLFSSGTTAEPKAIPWTHLTPIKCAMDGHFHHDIRGGEVVAWPTNIGWMMGPWLIYASLINDAAMALYEGAPTGEGFARFVRNAGVTMLGVIPSMVRAWRGSGMVEERAWDAVRVFSSTGEPSNREDYLWLMSRAGYRAPVIEYLGGTEIGGGHITGTVVQPASPATFTTPALGIDFTILDEAGREASEGETGELFLIPPAIGLSQRLLHRDHHEVYYTGCPAGPGGQILRRHGDQIARLPEGFFKAEGRSDDTMNLGGIKVGALELERVVDEHPEVFESAAVAVRPGGEGADRLVLFVVPTGEVDRDRLAADLKSRIAVRLNPLFRIHDLVLVADLPRTPSNKLMRRELRSRYGG
ncbi:MAG: AMP-binding protein [Acidobacteria bacterium]|nr:AMP-binding protein [Acidobacteriota bacterium]